MSRSGATRAGRAGAALACLGLASLAAYGWIAFGFRWTNRPRDIALFLALFGGLFLLLLPALAAARRLARARSDRAVALVLLFAALFRLAMLGAGLPPERPFAALAGDLAGSGPGYETFLLYDNDAWRYLWDGHVTAAGLDPYALTPAEVEALHFEEAPGPYAALLEEPPWREIWDRTSYRNHTSVYPPGAQILFALARLVLPGSAFALKLLAAAADLGSCWLLVLLLRRLGRQGEEALLYAWNPLAVKEFAGSGHVDAVMIFLLLAALCALAAKRDRPAGALLAGSALVKLAALPVLGVLTAGGRWRRWWTAPLVAGLLCLPFLGGLPRLAAGLATYGRDWVFNAGFWNLVASAAGLLTPARARDLAHLTARALTAGVILLVTLRCWRLCSRAGGARQGHELRLRVDGSFLILAALAWLGPAVMPWYLLWAAPLAVAAGFASWTVLTALSLLSYLVYLFRAEHAAWLWVEHGGFLAAALWELRRKPELAARWRSLTALRPSP